jgi:Mg/Co/Ni transporter MgtE
MDPSESLSVGFVTTHPAQAAGVLEASAVDQAAAFLSEIEPPHAAMLLRNMGPITASSCLSLLSPDRAASILEPLPDDLVAALLRRMTEHGADSVLAALSPNRAETLRRQLRSIEDTVGSILDPAALAFPSDTTVRHVRRHLKAATQPYVYVVERENQRLVGVASAKAVWLAKPEESVVALMEADVLRLRSAAFVTRALNHPGWREHHMLPVVNNDGRFVGAVQHRDLRRWADEKASAPPPASPLALIINLGELYTMGLTAIMAGLKPKPTPPPG